MEFVKPEKTLLVFDGEQAWQEQEFDDGEKKHAIVTKMKAKNIKRDSALLAALLGDKDVLKNFTVTSSEKKKDILHFELKPKQGKMTDVTQLKLEISGKNLKYVSYFDNLENEVSFSFDELKEEKIPDDKFSYRPPKDAEVTDL
jgi:outer membrane lipoprotein-sorting protein